MDRLFDRLRRALLPGHDLETELGRGGMGIVFRARDRSLKRLVAIKVLRPGLETARSVEAFLDEARLHAGIESPYVVRVYSSGEADGIPYFEMEYVADETLQARLRRGPLGVRETIQLGVDIMRGLEDIHRANVVHRDLKPGNIFIGAERSRIGDFGIARLEVQTGNPLSFDGSRVGTLPYMAPEQLAGQRATRQTDIYQAGAVLYEALTLRRWSDVCDTRAAWSGVPRRFARVLRRALAVAPDNRWRDAATFRRRLEQLRARPPQLLVGLVLLVFLALVSITTRIGGPLEPPVSLTLLRFTGPDSAAAALLTEYAGDPLERFRRIPTRPLTISMGLRSPGGVRDIAHFNSLFYVRGEMLTDTLLVLNVHDPGGRAIRAIPVPRPSLWLGLAAVASSEIRQRQDLLLWGRAAADSLVASLFPALHDEYRSVTGLGGSTDARAVDEYLAGEAAFQRDAYRQAEQHFDSALVLDPRFAQAAWQRALVRRWRRVFSLEDLEQLYRGYGSSLDAAYRELLEAQREPDLATRFARYRAVIGQHPRLGVARLLYADELYHRGALVGLPLDSALHAMQQAIQVDPASDQAPALDHRIWGFIRLGNSDSALAAVQRRERVAEALSASGFEEGKERTRFLRLAYNERFVPWMGYLQRWWITFRHRPEIVRAVAEYVHLGNSFDIPSAELGLGQALVRHGHTDSLRAEGYEAQGLARVLLGQPTEARRMFDSAAAQFQTTGSLLESAEWRVLAPGLGLPAPDSLARTQGEALLEQIGSDSALGYRASWALAQAAYFRGDAVTGRRLAARIEAGAAPGPAPERLRRLLAAFDSAASGSFAGAVAVSNPLLAYDPEVRSGDPFARAVLYLARGEWLVRLGRLDEAERALRWYENADIDGWGQGEAQAGMIDAALSGIARVRRAEVALARGRRAEACGWLRRVDQLWRGAEPGDPAVQQRLRAGLGHCQ